MGTFKRVAKSEIRLRRKLKKEDVELFDKFKESLTNLDGNDAVIYEFSKDENHENSKKLIRKAARILGIPLRIIDEEHVLIYYARNKKRGKSKTTKNSPGQVA